VDPSSLKAALALEPAAAIDWERVEVSQERVELYGELVPGTRYGVAVAKGRRTPSARRSPSRGRTR